MDLKHNASASFRDEVFSCFPSATPALIRFEGCYDLHSVVVWCSFSKFIYGLALFAIRIVQFQKKSHGKSIHEIRAIACLIIFVFDMLNVA